MTYHSVEEQKACEAMLNASKSDPVNTTDLQSRFGLGEEQLIGVALEALEQGLPICFRCAEGGWISFAPSDGPIEFWRARTAAEMDGMDCVLCEHVEFMRRLQAGLRNARTAL